MKAITIQHEGSFEQLRYEEVPDPQINDNQLLIKIYATSVNHLDIKKAGGSKHGMPSITFPWIPGHDFAGIVEKTGRNISSFREGDKVYGNCQGGSYAEYLAADPDKTVKMPENLDFIQAASVPHVGETAWQAVYEHGQVKKGDKILVHGAAGGVGAYAVQFAHNAGATVYATASARDIDFVKSLGADRVIDYKTEDFTKEFKDLDVVLSLVGGNTEEKSYQIIRDGGRLVSTVGISYQQLADQYNITAIGMVIRQSADDLQKITQLINNGKIKTDVAIIFPLQDAATGWKTLSGDPSVPKIGHGKIVLEISR